MNISIIGVGYVGIVTGTCFAETGNNVICMDIDEYKIRKLEQGSTTIYEPKLTEMIIKNKRDRKLCFTSDMSEAVTKSDICFIAVDTPMSKDGSANIDNVQKVAHKIGQFMDHSMIIVTKSTVPVGTNYILKNIINDELLKRNCDISFHIVSNPEFLREGSAIDDCMYPNRIIIGSDTGDPIITLKKLYSQFVHNEDQFVIIDICSAEMTKYAANSMLASRISFMNEISHICERVGADIEKVRLGIGSDVRIGFDFLSAGCGYGGSCFPKDVQALISIAKANGYTPALLEKIEEVNNIQKYVVVDKIVRRFGENLNGYIFAVWGLAFKNNTDDMRNAPSLTIIEELSKRGAFIKAYDPQAMKNAKNHYLQNINNIEYMEDQYASLNDADALILVTEWDHFKHPDFSKIENLLKNKIIFDGRNQYNNKNLAKLGFEYYKIG